MTTADTGEYPARHRKDGEEDIYHAQHGRSWSIAPKNWWKPLTDKGCRVIFLTTEEVPIAVIERADTNIVVVELEAKNGPRDAIRVDARRDVRGENLADIVEDFLTDHPTWTAITNHAVDVADGALTHVSAKGVNGLSDQNIVQTQTFMTAQEYAQLQALNAWCERDDLVLTRHIDVLNQSAGRNLNFRRIGDVKHVLLINLALWKILRDNPASARCRYRLEVMSNKDDRRAA